MKQNTKAVNQYLREFRKLIQSDAKLAELRDKLTPIELAKAEAKLARSHTAYRNDVVRAVRESIALFIGPDAGLELTGSGTSSEIKVIYVSDYQLNLQIVIYVNYDFEIAFSMEDDLGIQIIRPNEAHELFRSFADAAGTRPCLDTKVHNVPLAIGFLVATANQYENYDDINELAQNVNRENEDDINVELHQYYASFGVPKGFGANNIRLLNRLIHDADSLGGDEPIEDLAYLEELRSSAGLYLCDGNELVKADLYRGRYYQRLIDAADLNLDTPAVDGWAEAVIVLILAVASHNKSL